MDSMSRWLRRALSIGRPDPADQPNLVDSWVDAVEREFAFLVSEFGFSGPDVELHFRGNVVKFQRPLFSVEVELHEDTRFLGCELWFTATDPPLVLPVWRLLELRAGVGEWRPPQGDAVLDPTAVARYVQKVARGLRDHAADVLAGSVPADIHMDRAWER